MEKLLEGFEHRPLMVSASNPEYMIRLVENEGFTKKIDCLAYKFALTKSLPDIYFRVAKRVLGEMEKSGATLQKRFRIYQKKLTD